MDERNGKFAMELETSLNINLSRPPDAFMHSSGRHKKLQHNPSQKNLCMGPFFEFLEE